MERPALVSTAHLVLIQKVNTLVDFHKAVYHISADNHFTANFQHRDFSPAHQLANGISANAGISGSFLNRQADSAVCGYPDEDGQAKDAELYDIESDEEWDMVEGNKSPE